MGKVIEMKGDFFTKEKVNKLKTMLMDKNTFPDIISVEVCSGNNQDADFIGFGYFTITKANSLRRMHIHWYELAVRVLPSHIIKNDRDLKDFYNTVFNLRMCPVTRLFNYFNTGSFFKS